jgi:CheY-like chemotaxis protein
VDDDEVIRRQYTTALQNIDMGLRWYPNNEEAIKALSDMIQLRLPLHILLTDIMRPNGPDGLKFIEYIRSANYAQTVGGGLRVRYLPLIVISSSARLYTEQVKRIDGSIAVFEKDIWVDRLVELIVDALGAYRAKILSELQHLGIAVEWKNGVFQVLPAYGARRPELIETDRFIGTSATFSASYTSLCLLNDRGTIARYFLDQFERLLNSPHVGEKDMQVFFERHPEFILGGHFDQLLVAAISTDRGFQNSTTRLCSPARRAQIDRVELASSRSEVSAGSIDGKQQVPSSAFASRH